MALQTGSPSRSRPLLRRRNSLSTTLQALFDGLLVVVLASGLTIWTNGGLSSTDIIAILLLLGAMGLAYDRLSVYRVHRGMTSKALTLGKAWTLAFGLLLVIGFLTKSSELFSRQVGILLFVLGYLAQLAAHLIFQIVQRRTARHVVTPSLIIGTGPLASYLYTRINTNPWTHEQIVGAVAVGDEETSEDQDNPVPVVGTLDDLLEIITDHQIETVYIAVSMDASPLIRTIYFDLLDCNVNIHWAPNIFSLELLNHSVNEIAGIPILTLSETPLTGTNLLAKSIEDKVLATIFLTLLSPLMLLTALAIKLDSPGPVFFRQERTGWDGKVFRIWKFRSMHVDAGNDEEIKQATRDDPRVTRVGRFIRRTSIDELPQLFNVLEGSMSLVGPRPHAVRHNQLYAGRISAYLARHRIKPGITGLAQVRGLRGETAELSQMEQRIKADLEYINNWSIGYDLTILSRTFFSLFSKNAY